MWILKLKTVGEKAIIANIAKNFKTSFSGYPLGYREQESKLFVQVAGFVDAPNDIVNNFIKEIQKLNFVRRTTNKNNFVIASFILPRWLTVLYQPDIIFIKPAIYTAKGEEILELGSWDRKPLMKLIQVFKKEYNTTVVGFYKKDIGNISLISLHPNLTDKQKLALKLAVENGYYNFPRKITLKKLAQIMKVSFSTYQAHLSKAEANFIPDMFSKIS